MEADKGLFRDLLFSKFDAVHLILSTDFPAIPEKQRCNVACRLLKVCEPIFQIYNLGDDFAAKTEFRQLKEDLKIGIRTWIEDNGVPGYVSKQQERVKTSISKSLSKFTHQ